MNNEQSTNLIDRMMGLFAKERLLYRNHPVTTVVLIVAIALFVRGLFYYQIIRNRLSNKETGNSAIKPSIKEEQSYESVDSPETGQTIATNAPPMITLYPTYQPASNDATSVPHDWTFVKSNACDVAFPLPPKRSPYYYPADPNRSTTQSNTDDIGTGRFWQFEEYGSGDNITTRMILRAKNEGGSEVIPGAVEVKCSPNTGYSTEAWASHIIQEITSNPITKVKSKNEGYKWGRRVFVIQFAGGLYGISGDDRYFFFASPKHLYEIRTVVSSTTQQTKDITNQILNNLLFLD